MKFLTTLASAACLLTLGSTNSVAQDAPPTWAPLELIGCTFNEGADMDDLNAVIDTWNEWMDENGRDDYTGVVLSPHFTAATFPLDVLWIGAWQDSAALAGMQQWLTEGAEINADFGEVVTCPLHQAFAATNLKEMGEPEGIVPVAFQNCTVAENRTGPEAAAAIREVSEYLAEQGHDGGHWILRPAAGETADASYNFKWVRTHQSWAAIGDYFDIIYNQGGFQRMGQLTGSVMSCDSPRLYNSRIARMAADDEA